MFLSHFRITIAVTYTDVHQMYINWRTPIMARNWGGCQDAKMSDV